MDFFTLLNKMACNESMLTKIILYIISSLHKSFLILYHISKFREIYHIFNKKSKYQFDLFNMNKV
jgi:hypothetical protein